MMMKAGLAPPLALVLLRRAVGVEREKLGRDALGCPCGCWFVCSMVSKFMRPGQWGKAAYARSSLHAPTHSTTASNAAA